MKARFFAVLILPALFASFSCDKSSTTGGGGGSEEPQEYKDIEVVDGKVKFYITSTVGAARTAMGIPSRGTSVVVNGKTYSIKTDDGKKYVEVEASGTNSYHFSLVNTLSKNLYGDSPVIGLKLPYSQFVTETVETFKDFPMYASYSKETGNQLFFKDGFALVDITLKGSASIKSIKLENGSGLRMAGISNYIPTKGKFSVSEGPLFAVLNCQGSGKGTVISSEGTHFFVPIAPGAYAKGIDVTICDTDFRVMKFQIPGQTLESDGVASIEKSWEPDPDVVFYDGFDLCTWGGNFVGGSTTTSMSPSAETVTYTSGIGLTGDETCLTAVACNVPGTGHIQSNTWDDVSGKTVGTSHRLSASYVNSRGIADYSYLFRCQEFQGCMGVGFQTSGRGILQTPPVKGITGIRSATVSFDVCPSHDFNDNLLVSIANGGYVTGVKVGGKTVTLSGTELYFQSSSSNCYLGQTYLSIPSDALTAKKWTHIELSVERATDGLCLYLAGASVNSGIHSFVVDNIEVRAGAEMERGDLRVLYWNIQNGMWADQHNNYDNFVAWVKKYDPDVCVWCESATIYKDNTATGIGNSGGNYKGFLPEGFSALGTRYGHKYHAVGGARDNYPQTITSKYPITTVLKITDGETSAKPISHGAAIQQITVKGRTINIITLHTWPQAYTYGCPSSSQEASKANNEGDKYREYEMKYIIEHTKNAPAYSSHKDWLMMGDFNSRSRLDNWFYNYPTNSTYLLCQDQILNTTDFIDIIAKRFEGEFIASTGGSSRIDYMFASPSMYPNVKNAMILIDAWTSMKKSTVVTSFYNPSDHRPILVDFTL